MSIRASLHDHQRAWKSGGCATSLMNDDPRYFESTRWARIVDLFNRRENATEDALSMARIRKQAGEKRMEQARAANFEQKAKPGFLARAFRALGFTRERD